MKTIDKIRLVLKMLTSQTQKSLSLRLILCSMLMLIISPFSAKAQIDSRGTDFWIMFNETVAEDPFAIPPQYMDLQLFISSIPGATGNIEIPGLGFLQDFTVGANSLITVVIPDAAMMSGVNITSERGIHVTSDNPVTVYGLNQRAFSSDAYLSIPISAWGTSYRIMAYTNGNFINGSQLGIVAGTDGTVVTITSAYAIASHPANIPFTITLNEGEAYQARTGAHADLTGTLITSTHPIGVFGGNYCASVPLNVAACDHLVEMLPSVDTWGQSFVTTPFAGRLYGDIFRVLASNDNTVVTINSILVATLNAGEFYETTLDIASSIETSQPSLVAQYMQGTSIDGDAYPGDPAMVIVAPVEQFMGDYTVSTPATGFEFNHLNIMVDNNGLGSISLNGVLIDAAEFSPIVGTNFNSAQIAIELGTYTLSSSTAFGVLVYGTNYSDSYAYPGGQVYSNVVAANNLALYPPTSEGPAFSELCFSAILTTEDGDPLEGVRIDFTAAGANTASGFAFTNPSGMASFCYSGENTGDDVLTASQGSLSQTVDVSWTAPTYDCLGVPNGSALPNTPCEADGAIGTWSDNCTCSLEPQACSIVVTSVTQLADPCDVDQPFLECVLSIYNPNDASQLSVLIEYDELSGFDDEFLSLPIEVGSDEVVVFITLMDFHASANIRFQMGAGDIGCEATLNDVNYPAPDCDPDCNGEFGGTAHPGTPCTIDGLNGTFNDDCACVPVDLGTCQSYKYYLSNVLVSGVTNIYEVSFSGTDAVLSPIATSDLEVHIAYNEINKLIYAVFKADGSYRTLDPITKNWGPRTLINSVVTEITGAAMSSTGELFISSQNANSIYRVNLTTNNVSVYDTYAPTIGGDIAFDANGALYLATRSGGGRIYKVQPQNVGNDIHLGSSPVGVTGLAVTQGNQLLMSSRNTSALFLSNIDGSPAGEYSLVLDDELFTTYYGDMASGCGTFEPLIIGDCYASELIDFSPGLQTDGQPVALDRSDPSAALGEPDQINAPGGFVSLGVGGSITLGFNGYVTDGPGDDILIFETSFGGDACSGAGDERANIAVSQDGINFVELGTICRDGAVDINGSGLEYVTQVRITNAATTTTLDGYDVDGVIALYNCPELKTRFKSVSVKSETQRSVLSSFPNPTTGISNIEFTSTETSRTVIEVYDIRGQKIATVFDKEVRSGERHQLRFDGSKLTDGVYIYRLITEKQTAMEKFIIAK